MRYSIIQAIRPAAVLLGLFTLLLGVVYPGVVTLAADLAFHEKATGSLWRDGQGRPLGSKLIGQSFAGPRYLWGRPSSVPSPADTLLASPSDYSVVNPKLKTAVETRIAALRAIDPANLQTVPVDLVTGSASGLDPDISIAAADYQRPRIAAVRGMDDAAIRAVFDVCAHDRLFGLLGEPTINVLCVNLHLDGKLP